MCLLAASWRFEGLIHLASQEFPETLPIYAASLASTAFLYCIKISHIPLLPSWKTFWDGLWRFFIGINEQGSPLPPRTEYLCFSAIHISRCLQQSCPCSQGHKKLSIGAAALTTAVSAPLMAPIKQEDQTGWVTQSSLCGDALDEGGSGWALATTLWKVLVFRYVFCLQDM